MYLKSSLAAVRHINVLAKGQFHADNVLQLANRCPSACNRQPYHVYVVSAKEQERLGHPNGGGKHCGFC